MTPEQLDEIEKLAEAATPGPWDADVGVDFDDGCPIIEWYACGPAQESREFDEDGLPSLGAAKGLAAKDAAFIRAMREHALPLVKALREAREIIDHYERKDSPMFQAHLGEAKALMERDEALARCETLRELADEKAYEAGLYARRMEQAQKARSEARAEVERLRSVLRLLWEEAQDESRCQVESGYGHLISQPCWETVTAALKEGDR